MFQAPDLAGGLAFARQLFGKQSRFAQPLRHTVTVSPGPKGEQTGRFPQAVTAYRLGLYTEAAYQVTDSGSKCNLANYQGVMVIVQGVRKLTPPEMLRQVLLCQETTLGVLTVVNLRPVCRQLLAHTGKMVAGAREDKSQLALWVQRLWAVENPVTQSC